MFIGFRDVMAKYELRRTGQSARQTAIHNNSVPASTSENALHVYIKEPRRAYKPILPLLKSLNSKMVEKSEYQKIDVNDFMSNMSHNQRHTYILKMREGLSIPIFSYYWARGAVGLVSIHMLSGRIRRNRTKGNWMKAW